MKLTSIFRSLATLVVGTTLAVVDAQTATTTRYWDCSGGACGCAYLPSHLGGSQESPAHCYSNALFAAPSGNPYGASFYGSAAISEALGGGNWLAEGCGKCWRVTGQSNIAGYTSSVTTLVLKGTNFCPPANAACSGGKAHFDIAAPGFDFAGASLSNSCTTREPSELSGFQSCGNWMISSQDPNQNCDCNDFSNSVLRDGCENFKSLYWDNPTVEYVEISCPPELQQLPCWEENGNGYPFPDAPPLCLDPLAYSTPTQRTPTSQPPSPTTNSPVQPPTGPAPTNAPVVLPTIDAPAPTSSNSGCCSQNFRTCTEGSWCNDIGRCGTDGSCLDYIWLPNGDLSNCIGRWAGGCNSDSDCCNGLSCNTENAYWKYCQL